MHVHLQSQEKHIKTQTQTQKVCMHIFMHKYTQTNSFKYIYKNQFIYTSKQQNKDMNNHVETLSHTNRHKCKPTDAYAHSQIYKHIDINSPIKINKRKKVYKQRYTNRSENLD